MSALKFNTNRNMNTGCKEYSLNGKPIAVKSVTLQEAKVVNPGDEFVLSMIAEDGTETIAMREQITSNMIIDQVSMFEITDELGYKHAIVGAFGEKA